MRVTEHKTPPLLDAIAVPSDKRGGGVWGWKDGVCDFTDPGQKKYMLASARGAGASEKPGTSFDTIRVVVVVLLLGVRGRGAGQDSTIAVTVPALSLGQPACGRSARRGGRARTRPTTLTSKSAEKRRRCPAAARSGNNEAPARCSLYQAGDPALTTQEDQRRRSRSGHSYCHQRDGREYASSGGICPGTWAPQQVRPPL